MTIDQITSDLIVSLYADTNTTITDISKQTGIYWHRVAKELRYRGQIIRKRYRHQAKYTVNENFFSVIDTPEKAMVLGFWYSDGNVHVRERKGSVSSVAQKEEELPYIEKIKEYLEYNGPIRHFTNKFERKYISLAIHHPKIAQDLITLGCYPRKSLTLKFPTDKQVPNSLLRDFVRGLFDGDGGFREAVVKNGYKTFGIGFGMSYDMAVGFQKYIETQGFHFTVHRAKKDKNKEERDHAWHVVMGGNHQTVRFCEWLYRDAPFKMERKYQQYQNFLTYYSQYVRGGIAAKAIQEGRRKRYNPMSIISPEKMVYRSNCITLFCKEYFQTLNLHQSHVNRLMNEEMPMYKRYRIATEDEVAAARLDNRILEKNY